MDFSLNDEQRAIHDTARDLLASRSGDERLWDELCELGWPGIGIDEEYGGQGLGTIELAILAEQLGYACASTPLLGSLLAAVAIEAGADREASRRWLPGLASGSILGALALEDVTALIPDAAPDRLLVSVGRRSGRVTVFDPAPVTWVEAIDPGRAHGRLSGASDGEELGGDAAAAIDRALIVVAAELVGLARRALDLTVTYVKDRRQFGVPVGSFQAVQHSAAQMFRDIEAASVATEYAAWAADSEPERLPQAAAIAKAAASHAGRTVTGTAIQLHGGVGFTWEASLHWLFKRAQVDAAYLGSASSHRVRLAADRA